jgi:hypothetical protein
LLGIEFERRDAGADARPFLGEELVALVGKQPLAGALLHEHAHAAAALDHAQVDQDS